MYAVLNEALNLPLLHSIKKKFFVIELSRVQRAIVVIQAKAYISLTYPRYLTLLIGEKPFAKRWKYLEYHVQ